MPDYSSFFYAIGRSKLKDIITPQNPWAYFSMELALPGCSFEGGLGILASDIFLQAKKSHVPFVAVTPLYPVGWEARIEGLYQKEHYFTLSPQDQDFIYAETVEINANGHTVPVQVFTRKEEDALIVGLFDPGLKELYADATTSEHRLFQESVLGFGGYKALKKLNLTPGIVHLNEAATVCSVLACVDDFISSGKSLEQAIELTRSHAIFTNHTLIAAAVASFNQDLYERYVIVNIKSEELKDWLRNLIRQKNGILRRSVIAMKLCGQLNGVSTLHANIASENFKKEDDGAEFTPVVNGVFLKRWTHEDLYDLYHKTHLLGEYDLPDTKYLDMVESWTYGELYQAKRKAKKDLALYLRERVDQYSNPIHISTNAKIAVWAKRFAGYKRPGMIFADIPRLLEIMERENLIILLSGSVHPGGEDQKQQLKGIFQRLETDSRLGQRVFFIQRYDVELARHLVMGSDIWFNLPELGKEACGTSWMKAIANLGILISTKDGGAGDIADDAYLQICQGEYNDEVDCLYENIEKACHLLEENDKWRHFVSYQFKKSLHVISSARMIQDYLFLLDGLGIPDNLEKPSSAFFAAT